MKTIREFNLDKMMVAVIAYAKEIATQLATAIVLLVPLTLMNTYFLNWLAKEKRLVINMTSAFLECLIIVMIIIVIIEWLDVVPANRYIKMASGLRKAFITIFALMLIHFESSIVNGIDSERKFEPILHNFGVKHFVFLNFGLAFLLAITIFHLLKSFSKWLKENKEIATPMIVTILVSLITATATISAQILSK